MAPTISAFNEKQIEAITQAFLNRANEYGELRLTGGDSWRLIWEDANIEPTGRDPAYVREYFNKHLRQPLIASGRISVKSGQPPTAVYMKGGVAGMKRKNFFDDFEVANNFDTNGGDDSPPRMIRSNVLLGEMTPMKKKEVKYIDDKMGELLKTTLESPPKLLLQSQAQPQQQGEYHHIPNDNFFIQLAMLKYLL